MPYKNFFILNLIFLSLCITAYGQQSFLYGTIRDAGGTTINSVNISVLDHNKGASSDANGHYELTVPSGRDIRVEFSHVSFKKDTVKLILAAGERKELNMVLRVSDVFLQQIEVQGNVLKADRTQVSSFGLDPVHSKKITSPFHDFNSILVTLPGVVSNSELSSSYSVRGGNFDENLVFVNDIPIYRPLLVRTGQQEGLSFVNPDLVSNISFYAGGWHAGYGDKLSSVLDIEYKKPESTGGSLELSLLGGSTHFEKKVNDKLSFAAGIRNKNSKYLLNSLEVNGDYLPNFTDVQAIVNYRFNEKTEAGALFSYAENNYVVTPSSQVTDFGFFDMPLRLFVAFGGQEKLRYKTLQSGIYITKRAENIENNTILSGYYSTEREFFDVEGAYRLCLLQKNIGQENFDECLVNRGVGSNYRSGRNFLDVASVTLENKTEIEINSSNSLSFGLGYTFQHFDDRFSEFSFRDSADFVFINKSVNTENELQTQQAFLYANHNTRLSGNHNLNYGVRLHYHNITHQLLVDPRLQYAFKPLRGNDIVYRFSAGLYHQPPFYREFRNRQGQLNKDIKAQASMHLIAGFDRELTFWGRPFKLTGEAYYKYLWHVNPYDIDNVKIRYYSNNEATAYAAGFDVRLSGEFVKSEQSWFSLGIMRTKEDINNDSNGYVYRPTDQLVNVAVFFQDHIPEFPSWKMHLTFFYNAPLPFYAPGKDRSRYFRGESYRRADIGFSKEFYFKRRQSSLVVGAEILNLANNANVISYSWIQDISGNYFALPNRLSQRYINLRARYDF